jgi:hypothetical protein
LPDWLVVRPSGAPRTGLVDWALSSPLCEEPPRSAESNSAERTIPRIPSVEA